jgi:hypothetical protein
MGPAPQSIPFASRVRCLVALGACRRRTALGARIVGRRASLELHPTLNRIGARRERSAASVTLTWRRRLAGRGTAVLVVALCLLLVEAGTRSGSVTAVTSWSRRCPPGRRELFRASRSRCPLHVHGRRGGRPVRVRARRRGARAVREPAVLPGARGRRPCVQRGRAQHQRLRIVRVDHRPGRPDTR